MIDFDNIKLLKKQSKLQCQLSELKEELDHVKVLDSIDSYDDLVSLVKEYVGVFKLCKMFEKERSELLTELHELIAYRKRLTPSQIQ